MRRSIVLSLGSVSLAASLCGCGSADEIDTSASARQLGTEAECQTSTARILRGNPELPAGGGAAEARAILREPPFDCLGYDAVTLDRLYAAAASEALNSPPLALATTAAPTSGAGLESAAAATPAAAACKEALAQQTRRNFDISMGAQRADDPRIDRTEPVACRGLDRETKNRIAGEVVDELTAAETGRR